MDFHETKVPLYINGRKSGLNLSWFEGATCWKRQEVCGMLITHRNVASRALAVLALNSNYLDRWLNDCYVRVVRESLGLSENHSALAIFCCTSQSGGIGFS